jgi:Ca2+-binding EF-hand superfamily protein
LHPLLDIDPESLNPPPVEESEESDAEEGDDADDDYDSTQPIVVTQELLAEFKQVELLISEKLYQQGKAAYDLFARFDKTNSGAILPIEFLAAVNSIGVNIYPKELRLLAYKFPAESDSAADGAIDYETFIQYAEALRSQPRSTSTQSFSKTLAERAATPGAIKAVDAATLLKKVRLAPEARLQLGLKAMRAHMYTRSVSLPILFKQLRSADQLVAVDALAKEVFKQGFPDNLLSEDEVRVVCAKAASAKDGTALTYNDFHAFFQGKPEDAAGAAGGRKSGIMSDQTVVSAFIKLNSLPLRAHFKSIDEDLDGFVTVDEVIDDLCTLGMRGSLKQTPELIALVTSYGTKAPGKLQYSEFVQLCNARVNAPLQAAAPKELNVEVPAHFSAVDLVHVLHEHGSKGVSWDTVLAAYVPVGSSRISGEDFWHALEGAGFHAPRETVDALFAVFDPDQDGQAEYKEIVTTITYPNRNPRIGASRGRKQPGGEDNVPLGSGIDRLNREFAAPSAPSAVSTKRFSHAHKFDGEALSEQETEAAAARAARAPRAVNLSTLKLTDPAAGDVVPPLSFGQTRKIGAGGVKQVKGSIDFGGDHGGATPKSARASARYIPPQTYHINEEPDEVEANELRASYKATDIFNREEQSPKAYRRAMRAPPTPNIAHKSNVSFNQADTEDYHPMRTRVAPPGGKATVKLAYTDDEAGVDMRISGTKRRSVGQAIKPSVNLRHDATQEESADIPVTGKATRKHFDAATARGSIDHLGDGAQPADTPFIVKRQTRAKISGPASHGSEDLMGDASSATDSELVKRIDALVLSPRAALKSKPAATEDDVVEAVELDFGDEDAAAAVPLDAARVEQLASSVYAAGKTKKIFSDWSKGSNLVTKDLFAEGAQSMGVSFSPAQIDAVYVAFDKDGKGALSFGEFIRLLATKKA